MKTRMLSPLVLLAAAGTATAQMSFKAAQTYSTPQRPAGVAAANVDGDGDVDLIVITDNPEKISLLRNAGNGTFTGPENIPLPNGAGAGGVAAADLDGDQDVDLAISLQHFGQVIIMRNDAGVFTSAGTFNVGSNPRGIIAADLDGDQDIDLAVANRDSNSVSVLLNNGSASFAVASVGVG